MSNLKPGRVRLSDIVPYDGVADLRYSEAVEELSGSLMRHNAVVIEVGSGDRALLRCGLESARMYFRIGGGGSKGVYMYRAGRSVEDFETPPACMAHVFTTMGKVARAALRAIARHLRLRSDIFNNLLDDTPLPANEASSSILVASYADESSQNGKGVVGGGRSLINGETEKGLLTLISSDCPSIEVCDPNGLWYVVDVGSSPGDLLLLTGKALSHATAGLRPAASFRTTPECFSGRTSLSFRLIPQNSAVLDCCPISAAGHVIPQCYGPIPVSKFMDARISEEDLSKRQMDNFAAGNKINVEPSLRSVLSDPLSGTFLEDAMFAPCGHSFGGFMLRRVIEMSRCLLCDAETEPSSLIPNLALRAAAAAVKQEDEWRHFHNAANHKRKIEAEDPTDPLRRKENGNGIQDGLHRGVQYPFSLNEKVVIEGNKRTPDKLVGKEAIITSQCLNGWYLLKIMKTGESVRLQYRSLRKLPTSQGNDRFQTHPAHNRS